MKQILLILILFISLFGEAQDFIVPMAYNPAYKDIPQEVKSTFKTKGVAPAAKLPFIDDFSRDMLYPNQNLWEDQNVFINRSYGVHCPSLGVATFDAMNDTGGVYSHMSIFPSVADTLTSVDIRMDSLFSTNSSLSPADSIYFSFYIQPQGMGDEPQYDDSIVLQFYAPKTDQWISVWRMEGMPLDTLFGRYGTNFLQVLIPIKDTIYFGPNFKFRFYNYASVPGLTIPSWRSGVYDHWNLDYVYIDVERNYQDYYKDDIAISVITSSLLINYESMPWNQFLANTANEMDHDKEIVYNRLNHPDSSNNVAQFFSIINLDDKTPFHPPVNPSSVNMVTTSRIFKPNYTGYTYNSNASPYADFQVIYQVLGTPDINRANDTLKYFQRFYNYYAYDDGVPEAGYGLSTPNGRLAIQFNANTPDSIKSVQFYFNQTIGLSNQQYFYLSIWSDNNGIPGNLIYEQKNLRPEFEQGLFKFYTYVLDNPVAVSGKFYVGWRQTTLDNLNVGWDNNHNKRTQTFYNTSGIWYNSSFEGCAMIRPILGAEDQAYVGVPKTNNAPLNSLIVAPNPVQGSQLHLLVENELDIDPRSTIRIFNLSGQLIKEVAFETTIDVSELSSGIYFLQWVDQKGLTLSTKKFIVNQ